MQLYATYYCINTTVYSCFSCHFFSKLQHIIVTKLHTHTVTCTFQLYTCTCTSHHQVKLSIWIIVECTCIPAPSSIWSIGIHTQRACTAVTNASAACTHVYFIPTEYNWIASLLNLHWDKYKCNLQILAILKGKNTSSHWEMYESSYWEQVYLVRAVTYCNTVTIQSPEQSPNTSNTCTFMSSIKRSPR